MSNLGIYSARDLSEGILANDVLAKGQYFDAELATGFTDGRMYQWADFVVEGPPTPRGHQIYNFEVESTHTYVAGDVRVHNRSALDLLDDGDFDQATIVSVSDTDGDGFVDEAILEKDGVRIIAKTDETDAGGTRAGTVSYLFAEQDGGPVIVEAVLEGPDSAILIREIESVTTESSRLGESAAVALTPFLSSLLPTNGNLLAQLATETVLDTGLANLGEMLGNLYHDAVYDTIDQISGETRIAEWALNDLGIDFATHGVQNGIGLASSLIASAIFDGSGLNDLPQAVFETAVSTGINSLLSEAAFLINAELKLGLDLSSVSFVGAGINLIPALAGLIVSSSLDFETPEAHLAFSLANTLAGIGAATIATQVAGAAGAAAGAGASSSAVASIIAAEAVFSGTGAAAATAGSTIGASAAGALAGGFFALGALSVAVIIGEIFEGLFDEDPEARAVTKYNPISGLFEVTGSWEKDDGNIELAEFLGNNYVHTINQVMSLVPSQIVSDHHRTIGHFEETLVTEFDHWMTSVTAGTPGEGGYDYSLTFGFDQSEIINYATLSEIYDVQLVDGDLFTVHTFDHNRARFDERLNKFFAWYFLKHIINEAHNDYTTGEGGIDMSLEQAFAQLIISDFDPRSILARDMLDVLEIDVNLLFTFGVQGQGDTPYAIMQTTYDELEVLAVRHGASLSTVMTELITDLQVAADYREFLEFGDVISAIASATPDSEYSALLALTTLRAAELGLTELEIPDDEVLVGNGYTNTIYGLDGDDHISGRGGADTIFGGSGNDIIIGGVEGWEPDTEPELNALQNADAALTAILNILDDQPDYEQWSSFLTGDVWVSQGDDDHHRTWGEVLNELAFGIPQTAESFGQPPNQAFLDLLHAYGHTTSGLITWVWESGGENTHQTPQANYTPDQMRAWATVFREDELAAELGTYAANATHFSTHLSNQAHQTVLVSLAAGTTNAEDLAGLRIAVDGLAEQMSEFGSLDGDDYLDGGLGADTLFGGLGDDTLNAGGNGTSEWDVLDGGSGQDTYEVSANNRQTLVVSDSSGNMDTARFVDLSVNDLDFSTFIYDAASAHGEALSITWQDGIETGTVRFANLAGDIESFAFGDGTVFSRIEADYLQRHTSYGASGEPVQAAAFANDTRDYAWASDDPDIVHAGNLYKLFAGGGDDVITFSGLGEGWQHVHGDGGDDTYRFASTTDNGRVFIDSSSEAASTGDNDTFVFTDLTLEDVDLSTVTYSNSNGEMLRMLWDNDGRSGEVRIANMGENFEAFEFADGTVLTRIEADYFKHHTSYGASSDPNIAAAYANDTRDYAWGSNQGEYINAASLHYAGAEDGDDTIYFSGLSGWQHIDGGAGDDTYRHVSSTDDGRVFVGGNYETSTSGDNDRFIFTDLTIDDFTFSTHDYGNVHGVALRMQWNNDGRSGEVRIANMGEYIELFEFEDGEVKTASDLAELL